MEMEIEMELEEEEMEAELVFEVQEVDIDYEFDATMFFDFTSEESPAEALAAEKWFETAQSYPPSPFVAKLVLREDSFPEDISSSPISKNAENAARLLSDDDYSDDLGPELPAMEVNNKEFGEGICRGIFTNLQSGNLQKLSNRPLELAAGFSYYNYTSIDKSRAKVKSTIKKNLPRSSTLMKPTASMLAKQNRPPHVDSSRFQTLLVQKEKSLCNPYTVEIQAAKRQKLEGGHSRKVGDAKQQTDFIHKASKKDGTVDKSSAHSKLRLTIPREPDLETKHRAQRIRPKNTAEVEFVTVARRFKARPLNRKILEAPSLPLPKKSTPKLPEFQEFHLKTLERAMQHTSAVSSTSVQYDDSEKGLDKPSTTNSVAGIGRRESRRPITMDAQKQNGCGTTHVFKARPLNKKIFTSKGDIGVFRNSKRETTVPLAFNFQAEKRIQHNPPVELFSKLSLTAELHPNNGSRLQLPRPSSIPIKGSKENRLNPLQTGHKMTHLVKEEPPIFGAKLSQWAEVGNQSSMRSVGIR